MDVSRLSLLTSSLKNENETAMRQSLTSDRFIVEEVLTMELVDRKWSSTRTGGIDFLSVLLLLVIPSLQSTTQDINSIYGWFSPYTRISGDRRFFLSLIVQ